MRHRERLTSSSCTRLNVCLMSLFVSQAKSVQEKLAEAILKEPQCSSEPELSDTSTEEEEQSAHKGPEQGDNGTRFSFSELLQYINTYQYYSKTLLNCICRCSSREINNRTAAEPHRGDNT